jgi:hypothetical protein
MHAYQICWDAGMANHRPMVDPADDFKAERERA